MISRFQETLTLQYHSSLNPKFWNGMTLREDVRSKLLQIARAWAKSAGIPEEDIHDIIFTGGSANFNWTDFSDVDVHLIVDMAAIDPNVDNAKQRLFEKKVLWEYRHPDIRVLGVAVELFAQDVDEPFPVQQGVYSLVSDHWLVQPVYTPIDFEHDTALQTKVEDWSAKIERLLSAQGDHESELKDMKLRLQKARQAGIQSNGEFSPDSLLYKELRNRGLIAKIKAYDQRAEDSSLSL